MISIEMSNQIILLVAQLYGLAWPDQMCKHDRKLRCRSGLLCYTGSAHDVI